jgi:hypothetical protein
MKKIIIGVTTIILIVVIVVIVLSLKSDDKKSEAPVVEEADFSGSIIFPSSAKYGYFQKTEPTIPAKIDLKNDCTKDLIEQGDEKYCYVDKKKPDDMTADELLDQKDSGVVEIYFNIPDSISNTDNAKVEIEMICSSGIGLYFLTEFNEWARFGENLPSEEYKPDGSYGYLSCRYNAKERKSVSLPIKIYNGKAGVRILKEEATAYALIDSAKLIIE